MGRGRIADAGRLFAALAAFAVSALLVAASLPAFPALAETSTPTGATKTVTTGAQAGSYAASAIDADDGTLDGTVSAETSGSDTALAGSGSGLVTGTESATYAATGADDDTRHELRAVDRYGAPTNFNAVSPTKSIHRGVQSASYSAANVNVDDGVPDTTFSKAAADHTSPATRNPTANAAVNGGWTSAGSAAASDDVYASESSNGDEHAWYGWGLAVPSGATVTKVEVLLEWSASNTNGCLDVRTTLDAGGSWSAYVRTGLSSTTDRVDVLDVTSLAAWTPAALGGTDFRVAVAHVRQCPGNGQPASSSLDHLQVRVTFTYNVELQYTFTVTEPPSHWTELRLDDAAAAPAGCVAEVYRNGIGAWESLGWAYTTTEATHTATYTASLASYVNGTGEISVRYRCTGMAAPGDVVVDRVGVRVTYTPYLDTRLEYVYETTTSFRDLVTSVTFRDRAHRVVGDVDVEAWNWGSSTWTALWTVSETGETLHSASHANPASFIHASDGRLRIRYATTTTVEGALPEAHVDHLEAVVAWSSYALDVTYEFTATVAASTWERIWVNDSASAATAARIYLWSFAASSWTDLGGGYAASEAAHGRTISAGAPDYGDAQNRLRVRFAWSGVGDGSGLDVDLLRVTVTGNTAPTLVSFTATDDESNHDPLVLDNDGLDSTEVRGEVEDVNGETDFVRIEIRLTSTYDGSVVTYSRTVTASDRSQTLEPSSLDDTVVVWNPTADDDRLSFKFRRVWKTTDRPNPDGHEFRVAAVDPWGAVAYDSVLARTLERWAEIVANDGVAQRVYDRTGQASVGSWGQWAAAPGVTLVSSGSGTNLVGRYLKIENVGTGTGSTTISFDGASFVGETDATWTIPIHGSLDFRYYIGTVSDPSQAPGWNAVLDDADGAFTLNVPGGQIAWVWYTIDVPEPSLSQVYGQTFTIG